MTTHRASRPAVIRRRHVFYVGGYDARGAEGYHRLFARELNRFTKTWDVEASAGELVVESDDIAHWTVATKAANWQTFTRYEFVRFEHVIAAAARRPMTKQIPRTLHWMFDDLVSGALWRTTRAAWRFTLHLMVMQAPLVGWLALMIAAACGAGFALARATAAVPVGILAAAAVAAALLALLRPLNNHSLLMQVANGWPVMRDFARGRPSGYRSEEHTSQLQ